MKTAIQYSLKTALFATLLTASVAIAPAHAADEKPLTKAEVEKIIHDYIMNNAPVIMDSVDQYQRKTMTERSAEAVKTNFDELFKDDTAPILGNPKGDVTIVEFFDYNCGYCKKVFPELQALVDGDKNLKIVFKEFPILGPTSDTASKWALAAHAQGKYFDFHKAMMHHNGPIDDSVLEAAAKEAGLDVAKVKEAVGGTDIMLQIEKNRALGGQVGVTGTPAFIVGQQLVPGALSVAEMKTMIAAEREKAKGGKKE